MTTTAIENPLHGLTPEQIDAIGRELDGLHDEVKAELGERDARYIRGIIDLHRRLALIGRVLLIGSRFRPLWLAGTATLSMAKILENMEIGHNVMHGQWDWMNDPVINSSAWDWDSASTPEAWKHSHNYVHHTYTNIRGKDKDLGYEIMRIDPQQSWHPAYLAQPLYNLLLMAFFEWGVAFHDLDFDALRSGEKTKSQLRRELKGMAGKAQRQIVKDYVAWPALSGLLMTAIDFAVASRDLDLGSLRPATKPKTKARKTLEGARSKVKRRRRKSAAGVVRELVERKAFRAPFRSTVTADFTANIEGGPLFHVISGNLGYQVEHHLFPDMPSTRYGEIAPQVRAICERYGLPYNTGPFFKQLGMVQRTIARLAFPGGEPRPKPGPYRSRNGGAPNDRGVDEIAESMAS